mmetsp:Transcript_68749/g.109087  ORF Transcript_68749/g.109087 Transcript_68749/m.109087 type:complete len:164 (-) Transcript_68749:36-527(-)
MEKLRSRLASLGLTAPLMAKSISFGLVYGTVPLYIPMFPTVSLTALCALSGLSFPAALIGLNIATPFLFIFLIPFVRAGEWMSGADPVAANEFIEMMQADFMLTIKTFGTRLGLAVIAWAIVAPFMFGLCYFISLPLCRGLAGKQKVETEMAGSETSGQTKSE